MSESSVSVSGSRSGLSASLLSASKTRVNALEVGESSDRLLLPLSHPYAREADRVGPKAANLAALANAGLPTPGGFCITADAYRLQCETLGLSDALARYGEASLPEARKLSVEIRLKLYQAPIDPRILGPLLAAWRTFGGSPTAVSSKAFSASRTKPSCSLQCVPAGRRYGRPTRAATWATMA
jgi:hypothetical protein